MAKQLNITEQEELFSTECKLINLKYEYQGYTGTEKWAVVSELSEKELFEKYPDVISRYTPCVLTHLPRKKTSAISAAAAGGIISYMTGVIPLRKEGCSDEPLFREYENSEIRHPSLA